MDTISTYAKALTQYAENSYEKGKEYVETQPKSKVALLVVGGAVGCYLSQWLYRHRATKHSTIPSFHAPFYPMLGHLPFMLSIVNNYTYKQYLSVILEGAKDYCDKNGYDNPRDCYKAVWVSRGGFFNSVTLLDPGLIEYVFETKFTNFVKGSATADRLSDLLGNGIFTSDPPRWRKQRLAASRMFSMRNLENFMFESAKSRSTIFLNKLKELYAKNNKHEIDIYDLFAKYTLDTFVTIAFGQSLGIIEKIPEEHPFSLAFDGYVENIIYRFVSPLWRVTQKYQLTSAEKQITSYLETIDEFAEKIIINKIDRYVNDNGINHEANSGDKSGRRLVDATGNTNSKHDVLSFFLKYDEALEPLKNIIESKKHSKSQISKAKKALTVELRHIAMNLIIAGRDTTRLLLSWFIYELSQNPELEERILEEINGFYEENDTLTYQNIQNYFGGASPTKSMKNLNKVSYFKFLECCLLETLRLHPPVTYLVRWCTKDTELPGTEGWVVKKGTRVAILPWVLGRLPWIWGDDCNEFKPMRWWSKGVNSFPASKYPVFNIAPRLCLGRQVALMEAKIVIVQLLKQFRFKLVEGQEITYVNSLLLNMKNGMKVQLFERNQANVNVPNVQVSA